MKEKYAFKLLTSLILLLIVNIYTKAQFSSLRFERYNIIDGLSNNSINCILQTRDGYLWIATKDGLNRFDGKTFTVFKYDPSNKESLPENYVMSLYESKNGNLWVGTWGGGLCKYDPISESFIKIHLKLQNDNYIQNIAEDSNGNLWFGTLYGGIFKFNPQQNTLINYNNSSQSKIKIPNNNVTCILINQDNTIWYSTWGSGFGLLDETKKVIKSFTPNPKINSLAHNNIWHLQKYGDNKILISTDYGIDLFDIKTNSFYHNLNLSKKYFPILNSPIRLSFIDDKGQILVGTYEYHGIFIIKEDKGKFHVVSHIQKEEDNSYSLSMDRIRWIYQDNRKNIWLGTEDGLNKLQTVNLFERYEYFPHRKNTLGGKVVSGIISEHDSILWVSYAGSGFDKIDLKKNKIEHFINKANNLNSLSENDVTTIFKDSKNEIWIGTSHSGLNRFNTRNKKFSHFIFSDNYRYINDLNWIQQILEMKDGTLLVGTNAGLFSFDRKRLNFVEFNPIINGRKIFPEYFSINSLYEDSSGNLWVGTWLDGLFCLNEKEKRFFHLLNNGKNSSSISSNKITCITEDKNGNIWFGTHSGGINKLIVKEMRIENITTANGLPNDVIFGIIEDEKRNIWVSTLNGLCRYDPKTKKIRIFNNSEGVINNQFNWHASYKSKNGKIYFGTVNGFISFHPSEIKIDSIPPKVVLTSFKVFGKEKKISQSISTIKEINLSHDENFFSIDFNSIDLSSSNGKSFSYKLIGIDPDWVYSDKRTSAFYTDIKPGEYKFLVKASNSDGIWCEPIWLLIKINPAWWMTWWFKLVVIILISYLGFLLYKYRIKQITEIQNIRINLAHDLHDEIGSNLSSISVNSQMLLRSDQLNKTEKELVTQISFISKETIQTMRDIIWFINPNNDFDTDMIIKLKETASKLLMNINWSFYVEKEINFEKFNLEQRRNIFLIFKESLNNIQKHAQAKNCSISFFIEQDILVMRITDDGIGFDETINKINDGVKSINRRAEKLSAIVKITSKINQGTTVELRVPIGKKKLDN